MVRSVARRGNAAARQVAPFIGLQQARVGAVVAAGYYAIFAGTTQVPAHVQETGEARSRPPTTALVYIATAEWSNSKPYEIDHEAGRFANWSQTVGTIYDVRLPGTKWIVDLRTKTAQPDSPSALRRILFRRIRSAGIAATARKTGETTQALREFERLFDPLLEEQPLDHALDRASRSELSRMNLTATEIVAGRQCNVYTDRLRSANSIWTDRETELVFRRRFVRHSPNLRTAPHSYDWSVLSFRFVPRIDPSRFRFPSGITAVLPRIIKDMPLPSGVRRRVLTGANSLLGSPLIHPRRDHRK